MINRGTSDRIEDAIDDFEETWSPESQAQIERLLSEYGLSDDEEAIVELIRIDIELRYERGLAIELSDYLIRFDILNDRPDRIAEIAYEDFRSRSACGQPLSVTRWDGLPGVSRKQWFQQLHKDSTRRQLSARIARLQSDAMEDPAFVSALEDAGFHLVKQIGLGAFSRVYLANQLELADRFVVLKIVAQSLAEPEFMALLQHTNIVPIYSFHHILNRSIICMPYSGRLTLHDFLKSRAEVSERVGQSLVQTVVDQIHDTKIASEFISRSEQSSIEPTTGGDGSDARSAISGSTADGRVVMRPMESFRSLDCGQLALWIFQRLAGALAHAHDRGVLHNDLKPSNVLIRNDGEPALLDFNLSQSLGQSSLRHAGGTLPYMSPETYRAMMGQDSRPAAASDVYGLGVMLFEFVTARLPFSTPESIAAVDLDAAIESRRSEPDWRRDADRVSPGLQSIINRCLRFDQDERYQSAEALQDDLQREQQNLSLVHTSEPKSWQLRKWFRRHPRAVASGWIGLLLLAAVIPLSFLTIASLKDNRALRALADYKQFSDHSEEYLSSLMADPKRSDDARIRQGMSMLQQHQLLRREEIENLLALQPSDQQENARETVERHLAHLAILESQRLRDLRFSARDSSPDVNRLDQLIQATEAVQQGRPSRAVLYLQSERARLTGNEDRYLVLQRMAESTPAHSDSELYLEAVRRLAAYDSQGASELLAALADRNSVPSALRWTMLGRAQYADRKIEDAKLSFTQSIERAPNSAGLRVLKGRCHFELGERKLAENDYQYAIGLDPECISAWSQLGFLYHTDKRYDEALRCFDRVIELAPDRIWTRLKRAQTYWAKDQRELATAEFDAAMAIECDDSRELVYRGTAQWKRWDPIDPQATAVAQAALADFAKAHRLAPDRPFPMQEMARIMDVGLGRHEEAVEMFTKVLAIQPNNETVLINRALAHMRLGRTQAALEDAMAAMEEPNSGKTLYQAACVHALVDRPANGRRALTLLAKAISQGYRPKNLATDSDLDSIREMQEFDVIQNFLAASQRDQRIQVEHDSAADFMEDVSVPEEFQPF